MYKSSLPSRRQRGQWPPPSFPEYRNTRQVTMKKETKVRTRTQEGQVEVLVLVNHPMETGLRKDKKTGKTIPAHFIQEMTVELNGKPMARSHLGIAVSENPLLGFRLKDAKNGDKLKIAWRDNQGASDVVDTKVDVS